jgi:hypothetical protein
MALEDDLRPAYVRAADGALRTLSDEEELRRMRERGPNTTRTFAAIDIKDPISPHYLTVQAGQYTADLTDGLSSEIGRVDGQLPKEQARMIAGFLSDGPRRAVSEVRFILDALVKSGASKESLMDEVNLAFVRAVTES